jgi:hypothetical protein
MNEILKLNYVLALLTQHWHTQDYMVLIGTLTFETMETPVV